MTRAENVFRALLLVVAFAAAIGFALRFGFGRSGVVLDGWTAFSLLVLAALPLVAFWAAPGKLWIRTTVFAGVFFATAAATISLLGLGEAMPVIETWFWMLVMVGGGVLYWKLQDDQ